MWRVLSGAVVCAAILSLGGGAAAVAPAAVERDLAYGAEQAQRLDLSTPEAKGFATLIFVHGGSLASGDKADVDYGRVCDAFPAAGIACANVNYRLLPAGAWPAPAEDVAAAIAWVRANIAKRGGDPQKLFLLGHSSGAMLVALIGSDQRYLARQSLSSSALRGVMPMGSIMWDDDLRQAIDQNGRAQVEAAFARDPPVLRTNQKFVDQARALGNQADLMVLTGRTHYSNIRRIHEPGDAAFTAVAGFISRH